MDRYGHEQATYEHPGRTGNGGFHRFAEALIAYLRSRTAEHWVMFLAGLALGALLG